MGRRRSSGSARCGTLRRDSICDGNLDLDDRYAWDADDRKVSETMQSYFANFIKTGNPNGLGLPEWPAYDAKTGYLRERIGVETKSEPEPDRERYQVLDAIFGSRQ
jgi:para-nitrobenzyl esterase